jgi:hypothetical protein
LRTVSSDSDGAPPTRAARQWSKAPAPSGEYRYGRASVRRKQAELSANGCAPDQGPPLRGFPTHGTIIHKTGLAPHSRASLSERHQTEFGWMLLDKSVPSTVHVFPINSQGTPHIMDLPRILSKSISLLGLLLLGASIDAGPAQGSDDTGGWRLTNYTFVDGSSNVERVLAGTSSKMNDVDKYRGDKGNIEIAKNRWDQKTGALLAGVTYVVKWTDPQPALFPGDNIKMQYDLQIITSKSWIPDNQSANFNQGLSGIFLLNERGENYFKTDFQSQLTSSKAVAKGARDAEEKALTVNFGAGFKAIYTYVYDVNLKREPQSQPELIQPESATAGPGWHLANYVFVDGTSTVERVLAGTSSKMNDVDKYRGEKGNIEISHNRWDQKTGALLAGVTYVVRWTDPPSVLRPGEKIQMQYQLEIITSKSWIPDNQSVSFNQGMGGVFLFNARGENYFKTDFDSALISSKAVVKGSRNNEVKTLTANFGAGFKAIYTYEWREF